MELTEARYERIAPLPPVRRGNVRVSNLQVLASASPAGDGPIRLPRMLERRCRSRGRPDKPMMRRRAATALVAWTGCAASNTCGHAAFRLMRHVSQVDRIANREASRGIPMNRGWNHVRVQGTPLHHQYFLT